MPHQKPFFNATGTMMIPASSMGITTARVYKPSKSKDPTKLASHRKLRRYLRNLIKISTDELVKN